MAQALPGYYYARIVKVGVNRLERVFRRSLGYNNWFTAMCMGSFASGLGFESNELPDVGFENAFSHNEFELPAN
jgi:hypothetical protein